MPAPIYLLSVTIEFGLKFLGNPVTYLFVLKIDCSRNLFKVTIPCLKHHSLSQKRLKPSLGNSNVHRERNLDREPSASEILRDKDLA